MRPAANEESRSHRAEAVHHALSDIHADDLREGVFDAVAMTVADAAAASESEGRTLRLLADELDRLIGELQPADEEGANRAEARGRLVGLRQVVHWVLQRALSESVVADLNPNTHAHAFLRLVDERPGMSNSELKKYLRVSESEVSRVGRRVFGAGLASKRRIGGVNYWEITPRGKRALDVAARRFGSNVRDEAPELKPIFSDVAALLVGTLLEANVEGAERGQLEAELATTTGEMLRSAGIEVEAQPEITLRFLDTLDCELSDIRTVVNGSKQLVETDLEAMIASHAERPQGLLLGQVKIAPEKQLMARAKKDLLLAKADDGTWFYAARARAVKGSRTKSASRTRSGVKRAKTPRTRGKAKA
jgi:DNA-binding transcriptional ArsR family regulator